MKEYNLEGFERGLAELGIALSEQKLLWMNRAFL